MGPRDPHGSGTEGKAVLAGSDSSLVSIGWGRDLVDRVQGDEAKLLG